MMLHLKQHSKCANFPHILCLGPSRSRWPISLSRCRMNCRARRWLAADEAAAAALRSVLEPLAARYLLNEKRGKWALDPVENFHLSNGARLERVNWLGDTSRNGLDSSAGLMVNYLYKLSDIEQNHEDYRGKGKIKSAAQIRRLLKL